MKPSEVLKKALYIGYLDKNFKGNTPDDAYYMCYMVIYMREQDIISMEASAKTQVEIKNAVNATFLSSRLKRDGVIGMNVTPRDDEYKKAAFQFWGKLVSKLESEGK